MITNWQIVALTITAIIMMWVGIKFVVWNYKAWNSYRPKRLPGKNSGAMRVDLWGKS